MLLAENEKLKCLKAMQYSSLLKMCSQKPEVSVLAIEWWQT